MNDHVRGSFIGNALAMPVHEVMKGSGE